MYSTVYPASSISNSTSNTAHSLEIVVALTVITYSLAYAYIY
jgi:hypothetical protein